MPLSNVLANSTARGGKMDATVSPRELERLNRIYETILSTTDDFAYIFDLQGHFLYANAPLLKLWAKTLDQVVGKTCYDLGYPTWHADMHMREIEEVARTGKQIRGEVPYTGESGISGVYDYIFKPVFNSSGKVEIIVGTTRDVTDQRRVKDQLAEAAANLEEMVKQRTSKLLETIGELEAFSYTIAHDMRAPLRSLQGFSHILSSDYAKNLDENGKRFLDRIATSAERMDKLIQDVLDYSRVVRGELPFETIDVGRLLRGILETYPAFAPEKAEITLEGPFPPVWGNEAMLMQILSNLMGNAVKFMADGAKPQVKIWAESRDQNVRLFVKDNGIGIEADQHEKIFAIFQRVNKDYEGTGIGLAIVKKAIDRMGGAVGLQSEPGHGSIFWIELRAA